MRDSRRYVIACSNPEAEAKLGRVATAGLNAIVGQRKPKTDDEQTWASEVVTNYVPPRKTAERTGTCPGPCGRRNVALGKDGLCQRCWRNGHNAKARLIESTKLKNQEEEESWAPTPIYDKVYRKPDDDELKPRRRKVFTDPTGDKVARSLDLRIELKDQLDRLSTEAILETIGNGELNLNADLSDGEIRVLLGELRGFRQDEIAAELGIAQSTVSRRRLLCCTETQETKESEIGA